MKALCSSLLSIPLLCAPLSAATLIYNEVPDGDLGAPEAPTFVTFDIGTNTVTGSVNDIAGDVRDAITFTIGTGQVLESIFLTSYDDPATMGVNDANRGFFHIDDDPTSSDPAVTGAAAGFLTGRTFVFSELENVDLLADTVNQTGGAGITGGQLTEGSYTFSLQNTTTNVVSAYSLEFNVVPEPSVSLLAGLAGIALLGRRRRA